MSTRQKQKEIKKRSNYSSTGIGTALATPEEAPMRLENQGSGLPPAHVPSRLAIRSNVKFDLAEADIRIRHVLNPLTLVGEQYRMLRAKLAQMQRERGIKSLLVTSSLPIEGKTFTACSLAGVLAQEPGKRVLLIDADLRKPRIGSNLGLAGARHIDGLSQVLRGDKRPEEVLLSSDNGTFFLLPSGAVPDDPAELLSSPRLEAAIKSMAEAFDWVILDSPPAIGLADASIISPFVDAVILVVHINKTPANLAKDVIARIGRERFCGTVLNRGKHATPSRYYYHYYHSDRDGMTM